jgi:hypothetical protein
MTTGWVVKRRVVRKIGVQKLLYNELMNKWAVTLDNRSYHNWFDIPDDKVEDWKKEFDKWSQ